jgi:protein kinase-like protein
VNLPERIGPYAIERELGRGGMGIVYAGVHVEVGRPAAIKVLLNEQKGEDRFWRECEALGRLQHPGIVQVYEAGVYGGHPYLALEFVAGKTLDDALNTGGTWDSERTARLGLELCDAMAYVHERGLLHRDLKPENVLLDTQGKAKVTDFGLVRGVGVEALTKTGVMVGTPSFMPPEQAGGEKEKVCPASDVYSLGATLFMVLTGQPPFQGDSPYSTIALVFTSPPPRVSSLVPSVDPVLDDILLRCLAKQPGERYPDAAALGEALRSYLGGELEASSRAPRTALIGGITVMACLVLLIGGLLVKKYTAQKATPTPEKRVRTQSEARRAWRKIKRSGTSAELRQWCLDFAEVAGDDLPKVKRRLAEVSWQELGGPEPAPGRSDLRPLGWFKGAKAWLVEHSETAPRPILDQAQTMIAPWKSAHDAPILCSLRLAPAPKKEEHVVEADALVLAGDRILIYGEGGAKVLEPDGSFERLELGPNSAEQVVGADRVGEVLTLLQHGQVKRSIPAGFQAAAFAKATPDGAAVHSGVRAFVALPLGERTLVAGESLLPGTLGKGDGGGAYLVYEKGLKSSPFPPCQRTPAQIRAGIADRTGKRVFLTGGGTGALDGDYFLSEFEVGPSGLERGQSHRSQAAGLSLILSPNEERLFVGLNRGGGSLYLTESLDRLPLILGPTPKDSSTDTAAGVAIQAMGAVFLESGILVSYDFAASGSKGSGWLAFYPSERVDAASIRAAADNPGTPAEPSWQRDLPGRPRTIAVNQDQTLLFVGTRAGEVWVIPAPPKDLAK